MCSLVWNEAGKQVESVEVLKRSILRGGGLGFYSDCRFVVESTVWSAINIRIMLYM